MDLMEAVRDPATIRQAPQIAETLERAARQRHSARLVIERCRPGGHRVQRRGPGDAHRHRGGRL